MSNKTSNRSLAAVLAIALSLVVAGALGAGIAAQETTDETGDAVDVQNTTYLRVAHASPDAPAVDVYVDTESVLTDVEFGAVSDYLALEAGDHNVTITPAGDNETVVFEGTVTLDARAVSTLYAAGEVGENATTAFEPVRFDDDAFTPDENDSAISVIHLSPDAPAVDVTAGNGSVVLADNVSFGEASDYVTVPAGDYTVEIRAESEGNNGTVVTTVDASLEGGTAYSAVALGYLDSANASANTPFEVALVEDATTDVVFPGEEAPEEETETPTPENVTETTEEETETPTPENVTETTEEETATPENETMAGTATEET